MNVLGEEFFSCTGLAAQKNPGIRPRNKCGLFDCVPEHGARADHLRPLAQNLAEALIFTFQHRLLDRIFHNNQDPIARERLFKKIESAGTQSLYRIGYGAVAGDHDSWNVQDLQKIDSVAVRQADVEQTHIGPILSYTRPELSRSPAHENAVTFSLENHLERESDIGFVVNDENAPRRHFPPSAASLEMLRRPIRWK